jgi:type IV secretion system protein VirD4
MVPPARPRDPQPRPDRARTADLAVTALVTSPVALIRHLFGVLVLFFITALVLGLGVPLILGKLLGLPRDSNIYQIVTMLTGLVILLVTLRALFQPLILKYGGPAGDDTHGSARFATDRETRPSPKMATAC